MSRLDVLDHELARWQAAAAAIVANIYELYEHPAFRALAGDGLGAAPLTLAGQTLARAGSTVATVGELLTLALELKNVVARAEALRADLPLLFRDERLGDIEALLQGPSIPLPADGPVPLARRDLLAGAVDPAARAISPAQLLERMKPAFEAARDAVFAADRAWSTLPAALDVAEAEIAKLEQLAGAPGPHAPGLAGARRGTAAARAALPTDPIGAGETLEQQIAPALAQARAGLEQIQRQWREAQAELAAARDLARELADLHARALAACAERQLKVTTETATPAPLDEATVLALARWLERLGGKIESGTDWPPARIGLARWREQAAGALAIARASLDHATVLLRERLSLRGVLDAFQAKSAAHGLAEDPELAALAREARELLFARPTPLERARERVASYQSRLNARLARPSPR